MAGAKWTPAEDQALRDCVAAGMYAREVAAQVGRSRPSVVARAARLGVPFDTPGKFKRAADERMQREGTREKMLANLSKGFPSISPEMDRRRIENIRATCRARLMKWCPEDRIEEYRFLNKQRRIPAAEAKRIILEDIAAAERRRLAAMTPFERQLEKARKHGITERVYAPANDYSDRTLGGIASYGA